MSLICDICGNLILEGTGKQCDFPISTIFSCQTNEGNGGTCEALADTCDKHMHDCCAIHVHGDIDYCPKHVGELVERLIDRLHDVRSRTGWEK